MEVDSVGGTPDGFVKLRVGGTLFEASEDTLRSEKGSLFDVMLNGPWRNKCDGSGAIVLDRDPRRFRVLLNFLRSRTLVLEDGVTADGVRLEAEYFQVEDAVLAAEKLLIESEVPSLLKIVVDSRKGKLLLVSEGQPSIFPADLAIEVRGHALITLDATFSSVVGLRPEVLLESHGKVESLVSHVQDNGRSIRAIGRVQPGWYQLQLMFHVVPDESNDSIRSPHKKVRMCFCCWGLHAERHAWCTHTKAL